jgi:hypothetical protein
LEVVKRAVDVSSGLRKVRVDIVEKSAHSETKEETSEARPSEKKKWQSLKEGTMWYVDQLLDNDRETAIAK